MIIAFFIFFFKIFAEFYAFANLKDIFNNFKKSLSALCV